MTGLARPEDGGAGAHRREAGPWTSKRRPRSLRYGVAVFAAAVGLTVLALPGIGGSLSDALFFAVLVAAWYGGLGPGLLTTCLMVVTAVTVFALQGRSFPPTLIVQLVLFVAGGAAISVLVEALHSARRRLTSVLTSIGDAVIATDGRGRVTFANPVAGALTGWTMPEAAGLPLEEVFRIVAESTREPVGSPVAQVLRDGRVADLADHTLLIARDGTERPVADSAAPIVDEGGAVRGVVLVFREVSERRRAEHERAELLEREQAARAAAEAASRAKDRFLAVLSHELRTPLTPVLMAVSALLEGEGDIELRPTLEMIRRNVQLEARLIDDLLDVTRIGRGALHLEPRIVDAHDAVRQALAICSDDMKRGGITLVLDLAAPEHHVEGDPVRLQQVVWNLLRNAARFTPVGGTIAVRSQNPPDPGPGGRPRLTIEVRDTGAGIDAAALPRIFEAFEQGEVSSRHHGGLGLGLAIGRSLAEAHGGTLTADSPGRGRGSTFVLALPTTPRPVVAGPAPGPAEPGPPRPCGLRVLLVEDNKDTLRYIAIVLRALGYEVTTAERLSDALRTAAGRDLDLLLSDVELPDGTGLDLMRQLRGRGVPGLAMSGHGSEEDVRASRDAGFAEHLTKPVDISKLEAAIRWVISANGAASAGESAPAGGLGSEGRE